MEKVFVDDKLNTVRAAQPQVLCVDTGGGKSACDILEDRSPTLCTTHYGEPAVAFRADGLEAGDKTHTIVGDHENRPTDLTNLVCYWDGSQTVGTLTANNAGGAQRMPDKDNFNCVVVMDRAAYNQGKNAQFDFLRRNPNFPPLS